MNQSEDHAILLTSLEFQSILNEWADYNSQQKEPVYRQYNLNPDEFKQLWYLWSTLTLKAPPKRSDEIEEELNRIFKKIAAGKASSGGPRFFKYLVRVAAVFILFVSIYVSYIQIFKFEDPALFPQLISITSQPGTVTRLVLPDGTKVCLNAGSTLSYPPTFSGKTRNIELTGEAYFEVVKNDEVPMFINAGDVLVKVYGTSLNINSYADEAYTEVTLVEGHVRLLLEQGKAKEKNEIDMIPRQTLIYNSHSNDLKVETGPTLYYTAWKDGILMFRDTKFHEVLTRLSKKFNVNIELKNKSLADVSIDATFHDEGLDEILRLLAISTPFRFYYSPEKQSPDGRYTRTKLFIERK